MDLVGGLDRTAFPHRHMGYRITGAHRCAEHGIVTGMGALTFDTGTELPFVLMIGKD